MEAHDGVSARIAAEAGFEGVWASGLTMSASFGVRDNNELSWSQVVDHVGFMADAAAAPILVDGDTGYGNFNNMRRLVRKLEQVGVAGVTIEDKLFPKTNSFLRSEQQPLADVEEFCGKIKAGKDSQADPDFVLVARVEALIAGWGLAEAIRRAEAYHLAGADAILIHSRQSSPAEIFAFLDEWANRAPVVLVPTKYWRTPTAEYRARGVSVVVWANHLLRSAISAMQATARRLHAEQSLIDVEPQVAPLPEVFRLQGDEELEEAERRYLPAARDDALSAVVLAAGAGADFGGLTAAVPKAMLKVQGRPILARLLDDLGHFGCRAVTVVRGYRAEAVEVPGARFVDNADFATTGEAHSLALAEDGAGRRHAGRVRRHRAQAPHRAGAARGGGRGHHAVGRQRAGRRRRCRTACAAAGPTPGASASSRCGCPPSATPSAPRPATAAGSACCTSAPRARRGCARPSPRRAPTARWPRARLSDLLTRVLARGRPVTVVYTRGGWVNVNNLADLIDASAI